MNKNNLYEQILVKAIIFMFCFHPGFFYLSESTFASDNSVVIVTQKKSAVYDMTLNGIKEVLEKNNVDIKYVDLTRKSTISLIQASTPSVIITLGTSVTGTIVKAINDIPIVFSAVLSPVQFNMESKNITGVLLNIPIGKQFDTLLKITPEIKKIGIIYNSTLNSKKVEKAKEIAKGMNLELVTKDVEDYNDIIPEMESLLKSIDAIWIIADNVVCKPVNIQHLLLQTLKADIPVLAFSPAIVKAGALLSLASDYEDIGRQTADIVVRILKGEQPADIEKTYPRTFKLYLNNAVAKKLGFTIPADLLKSAENVYGQ